MKHSYALIMVLAIILASCASDGGNMSDETFPAPDKLCALTFDDGPDIAKTARVLDKLEAHEAVASFFVVGTKISVSTEPTLRRMVDMGCEIHNHSWGYEGMNNMTAEQIRKSIEKTSQAIEKHAGVSPSFFRPPNLATSQVMFETVPYPFASGVLGYDWSGGGGDSAKKIAGNVLDGMSDGAIILLHDVQPDPHYTPQALDILIPELKKRGYEFVTLTELFRRKGVDPSSRKTGMWTIVR